jgi:hypothetical protein
MTGDPIRLAGSGGIDTAVERLLVAYRAAGGTMEPDPASEAELAELRMLVAPLRLPAQLEYLWRTFQVDGPPGIIDTLPLETVEVVIGAMPYAVVPRALLLIASEGSSRAYIELDDADATGGGTVWTVEESAVEMHEVAPSLAALLETTAIAWDRGIARLSEAHPFPWAAWDASAWARLKADRLPPGRVAGSMPTRWLPRWLAAEGLTAEAVAPRGATTTIGALLLRGAAWTAETIRGRIRSVTATVEAAGVTLDDSTGETAVYLPRDVDRFGLVVIGRDLEVDVSPVPSDLRVVPPFDAAAFGAIAIAVRDLS